MIGRIAIMRTILVWLVVWPLVTGMLVLLGLVAHDLALGLQTFILTTILVPLISLLLGPAMQRLATYLLADRRGATDRGFDRDAGSPTAE
jgi:antibiotic biosynthesis monooxygenase (ABM) superfamily enzyme